ncbi:hypothetical protein [Streptomyces sp. NPDC054865]
MTTGMRMTWRLEAGGWRLEGHGWANCTIEDQQAKVDLTVSSITSAPQEFLTAMARLVPGETRTRAQFEAEPKPHADRDQTLAVVKAELPRLGRELLATGTGMLACSIHECLSALGPLRAVLRLKDGPGGELWQFAWEITTADLVQGEATGREEEMAVCPFGAELFFQDHLALLQGRLQVWV